MEAEILLGEEEEEFTDQVEYKYIIRKKTLIYHFLHGINIIFKYKTYTYTYPDPEVSNEGKSRV